MLISQLESCIVITDKIVLSLGGSHTGVLRGDETSYVWLVLLRFRKGIVIMGINRQSWKNAAKC